MFCLCALERLPHQINVKCDPEKAIELREEYSGVEPGYHMSKKHWNTLIFDMSFDDDQTREWIKDSYDLVTASLTNKLKEELKNF